MLSWRNPDAADHDLTMDDYLRLGVLDALRAIGTLHGAAQPVHAMGYCLGGTLLAIAAAALGATTAAATTRTRPAAAAVADAAGRADRLLRARRAGPVHRREPGRLPATRSRAARATSTGEQMAGSFQFLHSRDLVWTRRMREYLMGEREQRTDLMAWNADTTRMPARMHHEYLTALYLHNALATSSYRVEGRGRCRWPTSACRCSSSAPSATTSRRGARSTSCTTCATPRSPSCSTSGGHNAGIVSEPGHANRSYRLDCRPAHGPWIEPDQWLRRTRRSTRARGGRHGTQWLAAHSSRPQRPRPLPAKAALDDAPGRYVRLRYAEDDGP